MQIETVAEGIEADEQAETLRSLDCEYGQGYFFARPLEPSA
jgi:EAL domain-containing protein (putative c-di-GMP-specific phosphodiesterase class I)